MIFFTSDTHYYHRAICSFANRPWQVLGDMHKGLIERWNAKVKNHDTVFHLGDLTFGSLDDTMQILAQLNGQIHFIKGNHDHKKAPLRSWRKDEDLGAYHEFAVNKQRVVLCHFPLLTWHQGHRGAWMLHGHCHGSIDAKNRETTRIDVGVDAEYSGWAPLSFDDIATVMSTRKYEVVDIHGTPFERGENETGANSH